MCSKESTAAGPISDQISGCVTTVAFPATNVMCISLLLLHNIVLCGSLQLHVSKLRSCAKYFTDYRKCALRGYCPYILTCIYV